MKKLVIACSAVLLMAGSAFAADTGNTMSSGDSMSAMASCDDLMAQATSASAASMDATKKAAADTEMKAAQDAKAKSDDASCKMHAQAAVDALK